MRWEDERYVRFYTRDTPEFLALSWMARGLFGLILRKVDRAGILAVGKLGLKGVAVAVGGPWSEVEGPLTELLEDGCLVFEEGRAALHIPNFLQAQEAPQSDAARKRASRERAKAEFGADSSSAAEKASAVTNRDAKESQNVTESHVESHAVTNGHTRSLLPVPSRADPTRAAPDRPSRDEPPMPEADEGPDLMTLAQQLADEGSSLGQNAVERFAKGWKLTEPMERALRKIRDERAHARRSTPTNGHVREGPHYVDAKDALGPSAEEEARVRASIDRERERAQQRLKPKEMKPDAPTKT